MAREDVAGKVLNMVGCLWREALFYTKFSTMVPAAMKVPRVYFASVSSFNQDFILVIGDAALVENELTTADTLSPPDLGRPYSTTFRDHPPDHSVPSPPGSGAEQTVSYETAEAIVTSVAAMHANFWGKEKLLSSFWLDNTAPLQASLSLQFVQTNYPKARQQVASHWPAFPWRGRSELIEDQAAACMELAIPFERQLEARKLFGYTLNHGDFHSQNILKRPRPGSRMKGGMRGGMRGEELVYLDWQAIGVGEGIKDVAYFIAGSHSSHFRRQREEMLVRAYWGALIKAGVSVEDYPFELCWERYKFWAVAGWMFILLILPALKEAIVGKNEHLYMWLTDIIVDLVDTHGSMRNSMKEALRISSSLRKQ
jgi:hypothetical protein